MREGCKPSLTAFRSLAPNRFVFPMIKKAESEDRDLRIFLYQSKYFLFISPSGVNRITQIEHGGNDEIGLLLPRFRQGAPQPCSFRFLISIGRLTMLRLHTRE